MIKYGLDTVQHLQFLQFIPRIELRPDGQWIDVELRFTVAEATALPEDVADLTILAICTSGGQLAQIVPQDEGIDCEYHFTPLEKEQIERYIHSAGLQQQLALVRQAGKVEVN